MSVRDTNLFIDKIYKSLEKELNSNSLIEMWFIRVITIVFLNYKNIMKEKFNQEKNHNISLLEKENQIFPNIFDNNINILKENYPNNFFSLEMIENLNLIVKNFQFDELGNLLEDFRDCQRYYKFTSTNRNSDISIGKDNITAATQIFTPLDVSKYMVDNTIYYKNSQFIIDKRLKRLDINKDISILDPCLGSGNIILVIFERLITLCEEAKFTKKETINKIINSLYGFDIDKTAIIFAKFIFTLKLIDYDSQLLRHTNEIDLHFYYIKESNYEQKVDDKLIKGLLDVFYDASLKGSLIKTSHLNFKLLEEKLENYKKYENYYQVAFLLNKKYDIVITNPPYMGRKGLPKQLIEYLNINYPYGKSELYTAFIERCLQFLNPNGYLAMITLHTWMFIKSFASLRKYILTNYQINSVVHLGKNTFANLNAYNALACSFVIENCLPYKDTCYVRLTEYDSMNKKIESFNNKKNHYYLPQSKFTKLVDAPLIYWISENAFKLLESGKKLGSFCEIRQGLATGDNKKFLRLWHEVPIDEIGFGFNDVEEFLKSGKKYAPYNKGGDQIKWYTTSKMVISFDYDSFTMLKKQGNHLPSKKYYFKEGITWSLFGFNSFNVRYKDNGYVFDVSGSSLFCQEDNIYYFLAYLSSNVAYYFLSILAPTVNFQVGNISSLPIIIDESRKPEINYLVIQLIKIAKFIDSQNESSWNFKKPYYLIDDINTSIGERMEKYIKLLEECEIVKRENEKRINDIFQEIYQIRLEDSNQSITKVKDRTQLVKLLISFFIGTIFKRYSIEKYISKIDNTKWIQLDVIIDEIIRIFSLYNIDENDIIKYLNQSLIEYIKTKFYKEHEKEYNYLPVYWYRRINKKIYIGYYHTIKEDIIIDYNLGIKENYANAAENIDLIYKLK